MRKFASILFTLLLCATMSVTAFAETTVEVE